jgi:hypothetical protein
MEYKPGDLCLFRSRVIRHAVAPFTGPWDAIVLFTHQNDLKLGMAIEKLVDPKKRKEAKEAKGRVRD